MKTCGKCIHFVPTRSATTGRPLPSEPADCLCPLPPIVLPMCATVEYYTVRSGVRLGKTQVRADWKADQCSCFVAKMQPRPKHTRSLLEET